MYTFWHYWLLYLNIPSIALSQFWQSNIPSKWGSFLTERLFPQEKPHCFSRKCFSPQPFPVRPHSKSHFSSFTALHLDKSGSNVERGKSNFYENPGSSPKCQLSDIFSFCTVASAGSSGSYPKLKPGHLGLELCHNAIYVLELPVPSVDAPKLPLHPFYTGTYHFPLACFYHSYKSQCLCWSAGPGTQAASGWPAEGVRLQ